MTEDLLQTMKEECKNSFFFDEDYDSCIIGLDGRTGSVVYDIDLLSERELIIMNGRDYDVWVTMNGGAAFYEYEDALRFWKKRFEDLEEMNRRCQLGGKQPPAYFVADTDNEED